MDDNKEKEIILKSEVTVAVRRLVEFVLRSGDIVAGGFGFKPDMQEGTRIHRKIQKAAVLGEKYAAEVHLSYSREYENLKLTVQGICDGIIEEENNITIDEIKSTAAPLENIDIDFNKLHWAQALCYAFMYSQNKDINKINVRLTYYQIETQEIKYIVNVYDTQTLEKFFFELIDSYYQWAEWEVNHKQERNLSIEKLSFPFSYFRTGQREMAGNVYRVIKNKTTLFAQASTGIGKTISTLFPALKGMNEGYGGKIFYLTAKTVTKAVAEASVYKMTEQGLKICTITLNSKEKICDYLKKCHPDTCPFSKGHYDRVNQAIFDIINNEINISQSVLLEYSKKHNVCPFEFSLDISEWADVVICDYNYVFDPRAHLRRFFEQGGDYVLLVDEAHNMVDRGREMFSAQLHKSNILESSRNIKKYADFLSKKLNTINRVFIELRKKLAETNNQAILTLPPDFKLQIEQFCELFEGYLASSLNLIQADPNFENILTLYFDFLSFLTVIDLYDEHFVTYAIYNEKERDVILKLFCADPSSAIARVCKKCRCVVFFSATLIPATYYKYILGGKEDALCIRLPSPFERSKLCLLVSKNISTKYKDRENSYEDVAAYINAATEIRTGNYFVFFPSFVYMNNVYNIIKEKFNINTIIQANSMKEEERAAFLNSFEDNPQNTLVAFAVMGGIFSEGIDLVGEKLSGAIIVGVGLPQLCFERDIIKNVFNDINNSGYKYSYTYPGFNRVLQAAGRVIRSENDKGFIILLDQRFLQSEYQELFPNEWKNFQRVNSPIDTAERLMQFWKS